MTTASPSTRSRYRSLIANIRDELSDSEGFLTVVRLTLLMFLFFPGDVWYLRAAVTTMSVAALLCRSIATAPGFWLLLFCIHGYVENILLWHTADNHKFLFSYWCLALFCGLMSHNPRHTIGISARGLLGLTFLFATLRKTLESEFISGATIHYLLLADLRFYHIASYFGGVSPEMLPHRMMSTLEPLIHLPMSDRLSLVVHTLTWWTLIIEGLIAVLFLGTTNERLHVVANWLLLYFILSVYSIAPVVGFAMILTVLGYAQCPLHFRATRLAYVAVFPFLHVLATPHLKMYLFRLLGFVNGDG